MRQLLRFNILTWPRISKFCHELYEQSTVMFCWSGRDVCFTIVCIPCADHVSGILGSFVENSTVLSPLFGLHANIVEEYVLLSALLHDQSCLQSSPCFQHQFVWLPFSRTLVCKGGLFVLFMYMGARESCLRACATLLCHARVTTIGTSLCLTSSSLIVSAAITERS